MISSEYTFLINIPSRISMLTIIISNNFIIKCQEQCQIVGNNVSYQLKALLIYMMGLKRWEGNKFPGIIQGNVVNFLLQKYKRSFFSALYHFNMSNNDDCLLVAIV